MMNLIMSAPMSEYDLLYTRAVNAESLSQLGIGESLFLKLHDPAVPMRLLLVTHVVELHVSLQ